MGKTGLRNVEGCWFLLVSGQNIPEERVKELQTLPNNKIVIVSTDKAPKVQFV